MNEKEFKTLLNSRNKKNWDDCYKIAEYYYAKKEYSQAVFWYEKASECSDCKPLSYFMLGYMYQHGEGINSDYTEAFRWYEKAADEDVPQAFYNLAYFYQNGIIVQKDYGKALELLKRATAIMSELQLDRYAYQELKKLYETQETRSLKDVNKFQAQIHSLTEKNQELSLKNNQLVSENEKLNISIKKAEIQYKKDLLFEKEERKKAENSSDVYRTKMENQSQATQKLIGKITEESEATITGIRLSFFQEMDNVETKYKLWEEKENKEKEILLKNNSVFAETLKEKMNELTGLQQKTEMLQSANKKYKIIIAILVIIDLLCIFSFIYWWF